MKDLSPTLETALKQNLTYLCRLWTITRKDGTVYRFTDHDVNLTFGGNVYRSSSSFQATAVQTSLNTAASDMDITVLLSEGSVEYLDMERGLFDEAPVSLQVVSYRNLAAGSISLFEGRVRTITLPNQQSALLALTGSVALTSQPLNERYSAKCRAQFGDARCKVDLAAYSVDFEVDTVPTALSFTASEVAGAEENLYTLGVIEWTAGDNAGTRIEVAGNASGTVKILFRPPFPIQAGDEGTIIQGCSKTVMACTDYANLPNFRGEPYVPGDEGLSY